MTRRAGREARVAAEVQRQPVEGIPAAGRDRRPDGLGQRDRRDVVAGRVLEPRPEQPAGGGHLVVVAGVEVDLQAGREVVAVVAQRIAAPPVAVPEQRPRIRRADRALVVAPERDLDPQRRGRLHPGLSAAAGPLEPVAVVALQQEGRPAVLRHRERLILERRDLAVESPGDAAAGKAELRPGTVAEVAAQPRALAGAVRRMPRRSSRAAVARDGRSSNVGPKTIGSPSIRL